MSQPEFIVPDGAIDSAVGRFTNWLGKAKLDTKEHQLNGMRFCMERELATNTPHGVRGVGG